MIKEVIVAGLAATMLVGCSLIAKKKIEVVTIPEVKTPLNIEMPDPVKLDKVEWLIVTEENIDSVWKMLKENNKGVALFALRHEDYERLSLNIIDIRKQLGEYVIILKKYKNYYEGDK